VPVKDEAAECLREARGLMDRGGWIVEGTLESYEDEINEAEGRVAGALDRPHFDPKVTASLLIPVDGFSRLELAHTLQEFLREAPLEIRDRLEWRK
jgi:hypothetical protein